MSRSAAIASGPTTFSGVMRIALFEEDEGEGDVRAFVKWPGERVETRALLMPASSKAAPPATAEKAFVPPTASEPLVTPSAALAALLAVLVLTAGGAAVAWVVALLLFT